MGPKAYVAVLIFALTAGTAQAAAIDPTLAPDGDPIHGAILFKQRCGTCHQADKTGKNGVGPLLYGAYGRVAGKAPGFTYSPNLKNANFIWTPEKLNQWIQKPASLVPGVKMFLPPVTAPKDRADIIAYLKSRSTNTVAEAAAPAAAAKTSHKVSAKHHARSTKS
jgi:cytochrome c